MYCSAYSVLLYFSLNILVKLVLFLFFFFLTKSISIARDPSSSYWRMKEKRNIRELKCCHLVFETVNSNWKILTLSQTHKHMLQYLAVCFRGCVAFTNFFIEVFIKLLGFLKNIFLLFYFPSREFSVAVCLINVSIDILEETSIYSVKLHLKNTL